VAGADGPAEGGELPGADRLPDGDGVGDADGLPEADGLPGLEGAPVEETVDGEGAALPVPAAGLVGGAHGAGANPDDG
jgi:hypothetical protein